MITFNLVGIMLVPFFMVIVVQMKRMATQSHVFAYSYLTAAVKRRNTIRSCRHLLPGRGLPAGSPS
jgi:hypothetical protein